MKIGAMLARVIIVSTSLSIYSPASEPNLSGHLSLIALTGQIAPDTGGARFASVSQAKSNGLGQLGFRADLVGGIATDGIFVFEQGHLSTVVLQGQPAPGLLGRTLGGFSEPVINDSGDMVFDSMAYGGSTRLEAVFLKSGQNLTKVVDSETEAPGAPGQKFVLFRTPSINNRGDIVFEADLDLKGPIPDGIWMISGGVLQPVVLGGQPIAGTSEIFSSLNDAFSLNNLGDVVFASYRAGGPNAVFLYSKGLTITIAVGQQTVPNSTLALDSKCYPWINDRQEIVFANYTLTGFAFEPNALVRWQAGQLSKIAMRGDLVPQYGNAPIGNDLGDVQINNNGIVSFRARLDVSPTEHPEAIFTVENGNWTFHVSEGNVLADVGRFDFLGLVNIGQQGLITFVSKMTDGRSGIYAIDSPPYKFFLPHVADGTSADGSWRTTSILANRSSFPASATISYWSDAGAPLNVSIQGQNASQFTHTIPPRGSLRLETDGLGALKTGWALVQADQSLSGIAIYSYFNGAGAFSGEAGAPLSMDFTSMSIFVDLRENIYTGIALANPHAVAATVTLTLKDSQSAVVGTRQFTVLANGHLAKYITEIFSDANLPATFQGTLDLTSTQSLVGLTLRQRNLNFTSMPVVP